MADVTITFSMKLKPEAAGAVKGALPDMIKDTAKRPGFRRISIVENKEDPNELLFVEVWESEKAYNDYIAWRTDRGDMDQVAATLAAPPVARIWPKVVAAI